MSKGKTFNADQTEVKNEYCYQTKIVNKYHNKSSKIDCKKNAFLYYKCIKTIQTQH